MESVMFCPTSGCNKASLFDRFCRECGALMVRGPLKSADNTTCLVCKVGVITPADNFCGNCGAELSVEERIISIIDEHFGWRGKQINRKTLFTDFGADSLDFIELALEFEDEFHFRIPDDVISEFKTVGEVVDYIIASPLKPKAVQKSAKA